MRILQLVTKRQYRGAEVFAANLSSELINLNHQIIFTGLYTNSENVLTVEGALNTDLQVRERNFSFRLVKDLVELIKNTKPDLIQCNGSDTLKYMVAASFFIPKTPIVYRNISMISIWLTGKVKQWVYKKMFKRIDFVTSVGNEAIEDFIVALDYPREKTAVIRRGIPVRELKAEKIANIKEEFGLKNEDKIAIHVGNFSAEKNHEFLLQVFTKIRRENRNIKLILVGNGLLFGEIQERIIELGLERTVFLAGFRKNIPELLAASNCFVLSSKVEGVPGVILEAAAQKVPAVATNVGGVSEVLVNKETGFLIENYSLENFREKLLEIMTNDALRKELGENAFKLVQEEFNPTRNAEKFEKLYLQLCGN